MLHCIDGLRTLYVIYTQRAKMMSIATARRQIHVTGKNLTVLLFHSYIHKFYIWLTFSIFLLCLSFSSILCPCSIYLSLLGIFSSPAQNSHIGLMREIQLFKKLNIYPKCIIAYKIYSSMFVTLLVTVRLVMQITSGKPKTSDCL